MMNGYLELSDFYGRGGAEELDQTIREFLEHAADLRSRLGERGYLLDTHLRLLLSAVSTIPLFVSAEAGLNGASELRTLIRSVMNGGETSRNHPLHGRVKEYIDGHPLPYQESYTRHSLYFAALFGEFAIYKAAEQQDKLANNISRRTSLDIMALREIRQKICGLLGGEADMERLEYLFQRGFQTITPMAGFTQGMADALLLELISRDEETSKQMFQLLLGANLAFEE